MKKTVHLLKFITAGIFFSILFYACSKDSSMNNNVPPGMQKASIYLTDGPGFFDKVLIDIRSVQVLIDTCSSTSNRNHDWDDHNHNSLSDTCFVWDSLNVTPGIYDLLTLSN